jgi:DNA primase
VKADEGAKYLNSPETPIFNKSKTLYGLHKSKSAIAESRTVFLVEGYMDFLMSWQTGVKNAIAISGTALTEHHLERLRRFADSALVSFDNDQAGFRALERSMDMFHAFDFHVKAVTLGEYKDPAEACEKDAPAFLSAVQNARPAFEYLFGRYFSEEKPLDIAMKKRVVNHLIDRIAKMKSGVEQGIWAKCLAEKADIAESVIMDDLNLVKKGEPPKKAPETAKIAPQRDEVIAERLITLGFAYPDFWAIMTEKKELFPERFRALLDSPEDERSELMRMRAAYESQDKTKKELDAEFGEMMGYLELSGLQKKQDSLKREMRNAKDEESALRLTREFSDISRRMHELKRPRTMQ